MVRTNKSFNNELEDRDACLHIRQHQYEKRAVPTLVGAGSTDLFDEGIEFQPKMVLNYDFESQRSLLQTTVKDSSPYENNGRLSPGGIVLQIPGSSCNNAAYLPCSDIIINGETFQAKPTFGITISAFIMLLEIRGRHNIFETYGISSGIPQFHFEVDYGILRWSHRSTSSKIIFEAAAELVPAKVWTHVAATYNSTTGISQLYINGKAANRSVSMGGMTKDWSCIAHIGGKCKAKALMGFIDDFRIYNYGLSSTEIENISNICTFSDDLSPTPYNIDGSGIYINEIVSPPEPQEEYFVKKNNIELNDSVRSPEVVTLENAKL